MALWLVRAGRYGEHEKRFLDTSRVYVTWDELNRDLSKLKTRQELRAVLEETYPNISKAKAINWSGQLWSFKDEMRAGDWVVLPLKTKSAIIVAEITGGYQYDPGAENPYFHSR